MPNKKIIKCPQCDQKLRVPSNLGSLEIRCPRCNERFLFEGENDFTKEDLKAKYWIRPNVIIISLAIVLCLFLFVLLYPRSHEKKSAIQPTTLTRKKHISQKWIKISYKDLVDRSVITHSGDTVGDIIQKLSQDPNSENLKGLVQPYLERFSFVCNDILMSIKGIKRIPLVNILSYYPVASKRPAWADIFREGHYQLYFNKEIIRVFLKGDSTETLFGKYISIIRHPIIDLLESMDAGIKTIEVYAFKNNYANNELSLGIIPYILNTEKLDLGPKKRTIDIGGLQDLFKQGVILEASEVDRKNNFYLYGRRSSDQTAYGNLLSLSDFAVVYRSIFHYGNNAPYISLDKHEDNRYAKVNFGGLLENTRVGGVVLESDKLFKSLSVGLDPNTNKLIRK